MKYINFKNISLILLLIFIAAACNNKPAVEQSKGGQLQTEAKIKTISEVPHPVSLNTLSQKSFDGKDLTLGKILDNNQFYTRYYITYKSGELTISGILNVPKNTPPEGGWPVLFLNHGHIDTSIYTNGRGLKREQNYLAKQGFAVLHSDYRNHAESDKDPDSENNFRLGYTEDVINAVMAVKNSTYNFLSKTRFGMLGHSMGGGITQNVLVTKPELIKAAVLYAPVSGRAVDSFERWTLGRRQISESIMAKYAPPGQLICESMIVGIKQVSKDNNYIQNIESWCKKEHDETFWQNISSENFFTSISAPILYFHGTNDKDVPIQWSRRSYQALTNLSKTVELIEYQGQPHEFTPPSWNNFMEKSAEFFKENL